MTKIRSAQNIIPKAGDLKRQSGKRNVREDWPYYLDVYVRLVYGSQDSQDECPIPGPILSLLENHRPIHGRKA